MKRRILKCLALGISMLFFATVLPSFARADAFGVVNLSIKTSIVIGTWGHQKSVEWIYKVTNDGDSTNDYWLVYTEAQDKAGCFTNLDHNPQLAEALWGPPHRAGNPTEVAVQPGNYYQLLTQSISIGAAGASLSFNLGGASNLWHWSESTSSNSYWTYDANAEGMQFLIFGTSSTWGTIGSALIFRVTQGAHIGIYDAVKYISDDCWNWPYGQYVDSAASGWVYYDST